VRAAQYLIERKYFYPQSIPKLMRSATDEDPEPLRLLLQRIVAARLGGTRQPTRAGPIAAILDEQVLTTRSRNSPSRRPEYQRLRKSGKTRSERNLRPSGPSRSRLSDLLERAFFCLGSTSLNAKDTLRSD